MDNGVLVEEYAELRVGVYGGKFFPFHNGHVAFALRAAKQVDVLFIVLQYDEEYERKLCEHSGFRYVEPRVRERWIVETFREYSNIRVFSLYEHRSDEHMNDPLIEESYRELVEITGHVDIIFSNTHDYDDYFAKYLPGVEHVVFYEEREDVPVSATEIREKGVYSMWGYLPYAVQKWYTKRLAFCGWESAGKTFLARQVAEDFNTVFLEEYGRTFYVDMVGGFQGVNLPDDYMNIMAGHLLALFNSSGNRFVSVDTDLVYTQFFYWKENHKLHPVLDAAIKNNVEHIDAFFFLEPRNPFADDGSRFRVSNDERTRISNQLKNMYTYYGKELIIIDEVDGEERVRKVEGKIRELFATKSFLDGQ